MDARVVAVLRLLAETDDRRHAEVTELRPEEGVLAVRHGETREPHESGWWTHRAGGFDPVPPWEAHARRRREP